jgi:hypothetical protein
VRRTSCRSIAIVGNARSLAERSLGEEIDSCDVVIRMNAAPGHAPSSHGRKTSWLAISITVATERIRDIAPEMVFHMTPKKRWRSIPHMMSGLPVAFYEKQEWLQLSKKLGGLRPSTGMMCIDLVTRHAVSADDIRIYGFDFGKSGSLSDAIPKQHVPHDFVRENAYIRSLLEQHSNLKYISPEA